MRRAFILTWTALLFTSCAPSWDQDRALKECKALRQDIAEFQATYRKGPGETRPDAERISKNLSANEGIHNRTSLLVALLKDAPKPVRKRVDNLKKALEQLDRERARGTSKKTFETALRQIKALAQAAKSLETELKSAN